MAAMVFLMSLLFLQALCSTEWMPLLGSCAFFCHPFRHEDKYFQICFLSNPTSQLDPKKLVRHVCIPFKQLQNSASAQSCLRISSSFQHNIMLAWRRSCHSNMQNPSHPSCQLDWESPPKLSFQPKFLTLSTALLLFGGMELVVSCHGCCLAAEWVRHGGGRVRPGGAQVVSTQGLCSHIQPLHSIIAVRVNLMSPTSPGSPFSAFPTRDAEGITDGDTFVKSPSSERTVGRRHGLIARKTASRDHCWQHKPPSTTPTPDGKAPGNRCGV